MATRSRVITHYEPSLIESGYRLGRCIDSRILYRGDDVRNVCNGRVRYAPDYSNRPAGRDGRCGVHDEQAHDWESED